ncbi:MAG: hypothetical protein K2M60_11230 [Lachnospiraceae bacterium]|nr:hypothetical protein [Lachnospiraceae bacterium]MDE6252571.1 hypothetical protein [Lachnospiraceae bacterium]
MAADNKEDFQLESVTELIERYFITVPRVGVTYEQRFQEGYNMLKLIAEDFDRIFETNIISKLENMEVQ